MRKLATLAIAAIFAISLFPVAYAADAAGF
jgi:hypothetical protein